MVQSQPTASRDRTTTLGARQICDALRAQILSGVYGSGRRLPSSRGLATELGVSRTTVTVAYEQLAAEGFIEVRQGARPRAVSPVNAWPSAALRQEPTSMARLSVYGERLRAAPPWPDYLPGRAKVDFRYGDLAPGDFPSLIWNRAMTTAMAQRPARLAYADPRGSQRLRQALQGYLWRARMLHCGVGQIFIVNGSQQGLDLCARLFLDSGDRFVIEDPCYRMARQVFASTGAMPLPVAVDQEGLNTGLLEGVKARLAYVTPSHQFPLGGVMTVTRRYQLLEWARRQDAHVIEDDYDSEYRYDINPVPPLHSLGDSGRVIYLGTLSKTLSPLLRLGYLVVPPDLQEVFATAKQFADRHSPTVEQEALASLIEGGGYERHVRRVRRLNGERREALLAALRQSFGDTITIEGANAGLHVVVWFRQLPNAFEAALIDAAEAIGLGLHPISPLYASSGDERAGGVGLVMGYAALDLRQIAKGVEMLQTIVSRLATRR